MQKLETEDALRFAPRSFQKFDTKVRIQILKWVNKGLPTLNVELGSKSMKALIALLESVMGENEHVDVTTGEAKVLLFAIMVWVMNCAEGSTEVKLQKPK